jgi:hypothetical protein
MFFIVNQQVRFTCKVESIKRIQIMSVTQSKSLETEEAKLPLSVTENAMNHLNEMRKWTLFIAIIGILGAISTFFEGFLVLAVPSEIEYASMLHIMSPAFFIFGILSAIPMYFLLKSSVNARKAVRERSEAELERTLKHLKLHYICLGVVAILFVIIAISAIAAAIITGVLGATAQSTM